MKEKLIGLLQNRTGLISMSLWKNIHRLVRYDNVSAATATLYVPQIYDSSR